MNVSIFSAPEISITDLTNYLPANTTQLILYCNSPMRAAAFHYAYTRGIPFSELDVAHCCSFSNTQNISAALDALFTKSEYLLLIGTPFSSEIQDAVRYCSEKQFPFTLLELRKVSLCE